MTARVPSRRTFVALAIAAVLACARPAGAACVPPVLDNEGAVLVPVVDGDTVTCTGTATIGISSAASELTIVIEPGASVTDDWRAIDLFGDDYTIENRGSLAAVDSSVVNIEGTSVDFHNYGSMTSPEWHAIQVIAPGEGTTRIVNHPGATMTGGRVGIWSDVPFVDILNTGTITGGNGVGGHAIRIKNAVEGAVVNDGALVSDEDTLRIESGTFVVTNRGSIESTAEEGVDFEGTGGQFRNEGSITAAHEGIDAEGPDFRIENAGTITAGRDGIEFDDLSERGVAINHEGGVIVSGGSAIRVHGADGEVGNYGSLDAQEDAIETDATATNAVVTNYAGGTVLSQDRGIGIEGADSTVKNFGEVTTVLGEGILIEGAGSNGENHGTITSNEIGVRLRGEHIDFTNLEGGTIRVEASAGNDEWSGVILDDGGMNTFVNDGAVHSAWYGVLLRDPDNTVTNRGTVTAQTDGIVVEPDAARSVVSNAGSVRAAMSAVELGGPASSLTNSGQLEGDEDGVQVEAAQATVANLASIVGGLHGVHADNNATQTDIANFAGASIEGGIYSIKGADGVEVVRNTGRLAGDVDLGGGDDWFYFDLATASVEGVAEGGDGHDRFEFQGEGESTMLGQLSGFEVVALDDGSLMTLNAPAPLTAPDTLLELGEGAVIANLESSTLLIGGANTLVRGASAYGPDRSILQNFGALEIRDEATIDELRLENTETGTLTLGQVRFRRGVDLQNERTTSDAGTVEQIGWVDLWADDSRIVNQGTYRQHATITMGSMDGGYSDAVIINEGHWYIATGDPQGTHIGGPESSFLNHADGIVQKAAGNAWLALESFENEGTLIVEDRGQVTLQVDRLENTGKVEVRSGGRLDVDFLESGSIPRSGGSAPLVGIAGGGDWHVQRGGALRSYFDLESPYVLIAIGAGSELRLGGGSGTDAPVVFGRDQLGRLESEFRNEGDLTVDGISLTVEGRSTEIFGRTVTIDNRGGAVTLLDGATLLLRSENDPLNPAGLLYGGTLQGVGTLLGDVLHVESTLVGQSPGILTIDGDFTMGDGDRLEIEVGGTVPGTEFDQLVVTGDVVFEPGARIDVRFLAGTAFTAGTALAFISGSPTPTSMDDVVFSVFGLKNPAAVGFSMAPGGLTLTALSDIQAVPIPASGWLFWSAAAGLFAARRRPSADSRRHSGATASAAVAATVTVRFASNAVSTRRITR